MNFQPFSVVFEPLPDVGILVVRGIILNQVDLVVSGFATRGCGLFQKAQIGFGIEDRFAAVIESGLLEIDCAKDFHTLSGARHRNQRLGCNAGPGLVEGRVLPEAGLVLEENIGVFIPRFFLMFG